MKLGKAGKFFVELVIYVVIIGGIVWGVPRFLSWYLQTPYPMAAITSGSMWPLLHEGDMVFIRGNIKKEDVKVGDVIIWRAAENELGFIIHRVVAVREKDFVTKGDANFTDDPPVTYDRIIGRAVTFKSGKLMHVPWLGSLTTLAGKFRQ